MKQIFWETKTFFKKLDYRFLVQTTKIENTLFPFENPLSDILIQIERRLQNGPTTESGVLPVTTLLFWKIVPSFRTS